MPAPRSITTTGIVLKRINFGEADRILTILTPDYGKLSLLAKGVRKSTSKLAGGIELFSVSSISFIPPKKDVGTLVSTKLVSHFGEIVKSIERTNVGYNFLTIMDTSTQDEPGGEFYNLLLKSISALNNTSFKLELVETWFYMQLIKILGLEPNLTTDREGYSLAEASRYNFDFDSMSFYRRSDGQYSSKHIKLLRLLVSEPIDRISAVGGVEEQLPVCGRLAERIFQTVV